MKNEKPYFEYKEWDKNFEAFQSYISLSHQNSEYLRTYGRTILFKILFYLTSFSSSGKSVYLSNPTGIIDWGIVPSLSHT